MAFTLLEFDTVTDDGEPVQPPTVRGTAKASATAYRLAAGTVYAAVIPDADMYVRVASIATDLATNDDPFVSAGETKGFPVQKRSRPYVSGLDAA